MDKTLFEKEFPLQQDLIYLNHAGVAPWPARTTAAVKQFAAENSRLGASRYAHWVNKEAQLRKQIQRLINAPSDMDVALVKNTSEALSVVACGLDWKDGDNVVTSTEEFPSNRIPWQAQRPLGVDLREVDIRNEAPETVLMAACDNRTRVLTISSVQYGSGIRLDLENLGDFCSKNNILFCIDAIQSIGACEFDVQANKADFVMADGHKWMLGPEGLALFYSRPAARDRLKLNQYGWHMLEHAGDFETREWQPAQSAQRFECGSPNMLGIHALSASLALLDEIGIRKITRAVIDNTSYLLELLKDVKGITFITPAQEQRRAGIITFTLSGIDMPALHGKLLEHKLICARRGGGIRFSPHFYTSEEDLGKAVDIVKLCIK